MSTIRRGINRLSLGWAIVLLWASASLVLAQVSPSPVHPSSAGGAATSVSAEAFPLLAPSGSAGAPSYSFSGDTNTGIYRGGSEVVVISSASEAALAVNQQGVVAAAVQPDMQWGWSGTTNNANAALDTGLERLAAGVIGTTNGSTGEGWIQNEAGDQFLTADVTNNTTTFSNLTDLTVSVTTGRKYVFELVLFWANSINTDGAKLDLNGGTATATNFRTAAASFRGDTGAAQVFTLAQSTTLAGVLNIGTLQGPSNPGYIEVKGTFEPSSTGTFIPRFAMNSATTGTLTVFRGSYLLVKDMP